MFASTKEAGELMGVPDVCKVPSPVGPIPTPFPNMGMCMMATNFSMKVKICMKEALTTKSEIPQSSGDEAGVAGGVVSGMIKGPVKFINGSTKVKFEGNPAVFLGSPTAHNGSNANVPAGSQISPSQVKVMIMS
ncbi:MAG: DUF4150 domain-containing protein [Candidatus Latescibacteria bacterium]|nr:DUF4150 domain-containing protein [Candidatus Latescibacterota bacterium]